MKWFAMMARGGASWTESPMARRIAVVMSTGLIPRPGDA